jgi:predicted transposase YdaD
MGSLNEAARSALETLMQKGTYEYQSEFARKYVAQGREEGREEGRKEGREEGREEGLQKGLEDGEREALFEVLSARGLEVGEDERRRIQACTDLMQLKRWLRRAVSARATHELFTP